MESQVATPADFPNTTGAAEPGMDSGLISEAGPVGREGPYPRAARLVYDMLQGILWAILVSIPLWLFILSTLHQVTP